MSEYKYRVLMYPADHPDRLDDIRVYNFNDVNELWPKLIDKKNPINAALRRETLRELATYDSDLVELLSADYEDWVEFEFTNVLTDLKYHITHDLKTVYDYKYWGIVHRLEVIV